ncbi:MAG: hypothetical protein ACK40L_02690 [Hydrogenophaga sp.]
MGTSIERELTPGEVARMPALKQAMINAGRNGCATAFTFLAAFDGTNNHRANLELAGDQYPTNIAHLEKQAKDSKAETLKSAYVPGVGTGGDQGGLIHAGVLPTPAVDAAAEKAYVQFRDAAIAYLANNPSATPADIGVAVVGFSRGGPSALRFAQLLNDRGLVAPDGTVMIPPGQVPVTAMALIDPVDRFVKGPMHMPPNVQGQVLVVQAEHEHRSDFRAMDFGHDPRVKTVQHPGNHVGLGGGYDPHGTSANVLEGITGYFQQRGIAIADVDPALKHNPAERQWLRSEVYQTARNGERLSTEHGEPRTVWRSDPPEQGRRITQPSLPPEHRQWLQQARAELAPRLSAHGLNGEACLQVAAACVCSAARHARWGAPRQFLVSPDGQRVGIQHENLRLSELEVSTALQTSTGQHLQAAREAQAAHDQAAADRAPPVREPMRVRATELVR